MQKNKLTIANFDKKIENQFDLLKAFFNNSLY